MSNLNSIVLLKKKYDGRIIPIDNKLLNTTLIKNGHLFEKECRIIDAKDPISRMRLFSASYSLTKDQTLTKTQYDLLTIACSKEEINTRKLTEEECKEVVYNTHRFIHDVLEINKFMITDDNYENPETFTWLERGKIFINKKLINGEST